jgi:hypothetical protein
MALARHDKALRKEAVKAMRGRIALHEHYVRNAMKSLLVLAKARPPYSGPSPSYRRIFGVRTRRVAFGYLASSSINQRCG